MQRRIFLRGMAVAGAAAMTGAPIVQAATGARVKRVEVSEFVFSPTRIQVGPGDRIIWTNRDIVPHTATATDQSWDTGEIGPNESVEITVRAAMSEAYFCRFHPSMKAQLQLR